MCWQKNEAKPGVSWVQICESYFHKQPHAKMPTGFNNVKMKKKNQMLHEMNII